MHDESVVFDELRRLLVSFKVTEIGEVNGREPVHEPELEHE